MTSGWRPQFSMGEHVLYDAEDRWRLESCAIVVWSVTAVGEVWAWSWAISASLVHSCSSIFFPRLILCSVMLRMSLLNSFQVLYQHKRWSLSRFGIPLTVQLIRNSVVSSMVIAAFATLLAQIF